MTWSILLWRKQTIVTFQNGADFEQTHQRHRQPIFSISCLGTCAGCSQTHKTAKDWSGKHLLVNAKTLNMLVKSVQNRSISSEICPEIPTKSAIIYRLFYGECSPENFHEIPTKLVDFSKNLSKSRKIWLFFPQPIRSTVWMVGWAQVFTSTILKVVNKI